MRYLTGLLFALLAGCTTLVKTDLPSAELQRSIRAGELIAAGDEIRVTTFDHKVIELTVTSVNADVIAGEELAIPIDTVAAVEVRRTSPERVVAVTAGSVLVGSWLLALLVSMIVVFPA